MRATRHQRQALNRRFPDLICASEQTIQTALKEGRKTVFFLDKDIEVSPAAGIFVTLNPAGKGYGGRSRLPDNLKQLFRPIAMTVPDNELIAEVLLTSEGFRTAKSLGRKVVKLFEICRQLLSRQQHYDWGLRALKTILGIVGPLLRRARAGGAAGDDSKLGGSIVTWPRPTVRC